MSGVLENMQAQINALIQAVQTLQANAAAAPVVAPVATLTAAPVAAANPFGGLGAPVAAAAPAAVNVTAEMITDLITPHLGNEAVKGQLQAAMQAMGIDAIQNTRPDQYAELYQRFAAIVGGGAAAGAATGGAGII